MTDIKTIFSSSQREFLKGEVASSGGNEVFFEVKLNDHQKAEKVRVLGRGNKFSAPAIIRHLRPGDAVVHNHPSGNLTPSDADIEVASLLGNRGIGFYIIDNDASNIYEVVQNDPSFQIQKIDYTRIENYFKENSTFHRLFTDYEYRQGQVNMALDIATAFNQDKIALIEAGTGIGKSLAYLTCAAIWSDSNKERIVISTKTINLQEQLIHKDIPQLQEILDVDFSASIVKGRNNYICKRKIESLKYDTIQIKYIDIDSNDVETLRRWAEKTKDGSLSDIDFRINYDLWERFRSESDECLGNKCRYAESCFVNRARKKASSSDLLIVNHHLLMADIILRNFLNLDKAILPQYTKIILDEAHHLEDVATSFFAKNLTKTRLSKNLNKIHKHQKEDTETGVLPFIRDRIKSSKSISEKEIRKFETNYYPLIVNQKMHLSEQFSDIINEIIEYMLKTDDKKNNIVKLITRDFLHTDYYFKTVILKKLEKFIKELYEFIDTIKSISVILKEISENQELDLSNQILELSKIKQRLIEFSGDIYDILLTDEEDTNLVKWIEINKREKTYTCKISSVPVNISKELEEGIFEKFETVILTSATLATGGNFEFIKSRIGLLKFSDRLIESIYESPFDYNSKMLVGIPLDIPYPSSLDFINETAGIIKKAIKISRGRTFILFTSYKMLIEAWEKISGKIDYNIMKQGDNPRHHLLENFKNDISSVLLGTDSFWEGVDVRGEALESIIIMRLPFKVPTEPVFIARAQEIEKRGGDSFLEYSIPLAVIKFKQGFGRLIRNKTDRGIILILDKRIHEKQYGRYFIDSLPKIPTAKGTKDEVLYQIERFFS